MRHSGWQPDSRTVTIVAGNNDLSVTLLPVLTQGPPGPPGPKGEKGEKGEKGDPGTGFDIAITDARYPKLLGDNNYVGTQNVNGAVTIQGTVTAASFVGDGSGLTNVTATLTPPCQLIPFGNKRLLIGRDPHLSDPDHPTDGSNCAVPDGSPVAVSGPRPNLSGARIVNVPVEAHSDWSFADLSRAELQLFGSAILVGANLRGTILDSHGGYNMRFADATGASFRTHARATSLAPTSPTPI